MSIIQGKSPQFKLKSPLKTVWVTQPWGVDWSGGLLPLGNEKFGNYS